MILVELLDEPNRLQTIVGDVWLELELREHSFDSQDVEPVVVDD